MFNRWITGIAGVVCAFMNTIWFFVGKAEIGILVMALVVSTMLVMLSLYGTKLFKERE